MPRSRTETLECRHCGCKQSTVTHTRVIETSWRGRRFVSIRRRRICRFCKLPYTTVESYEEENEIGIPEIPAEPKAYCPPPTPIPEKPSRRVAASSPPKKNPPSGDKKKTMPQKTPKTGKSGKNPYL
jgi:hypothetical protein